MGETHTCEDARTITLGVVQADGSIANVTMSVVNVRDANGDEVNFSDREVLQAIYGEIRALRQMYGRATGQAFAGLQAQADDPSQIG